VGALEKGDEGARKRREAMADWYDEREARARFLLGSLLADVYENECAADLLRDAILRRPEMAEAHVELGFVLRRDEDYEGMIEAFREALSIDPAAVRASIHQEPDELVSLRRILYPERPASPPAEATPVLAMPDYVREGGTLVGLAREHIAAGRDEEAAAALVSVLRLDANHRFAAALLTLTCLLIQSGGGSAGALAEAEGVLREVDPWLAELLFES
jgi:tetratricopeptide (TPR) repeat protein